MAYLLASMAYLGGQGFDLHSFHAESIVRSSCCLLVWPTSHAAPRGGQKSDWQRCSLQRYDLRRRDSVTFVVRSLAVVVPDGDRHHWYVI